MAYITAASLHWPALSCVATRTVYSLCVPQGKELTAFCEQLVSFCHRVDVSALTAPVVHLKLLLSAG